MPPRRAARRSSMGARAGGRWNWPSRSPTRSGSRTRMYADLRDFLSDLDKRRLLARVSDSVSPDLEIAAITDRASKLPAVGPALLFERPSGFDMPVASNV